MESPSIDRYLDDLRRALGITPGFSPRIVLEIQDHLTSSAETHVQNGVSEELAVELAIEEIGSPRAIAEAILQTYSDEASLESVPIPLVTRRTSMIALNVVGIGWSAKPYDQMQRSDLDTNLTFKPSPQDLEARVIMSGVEGNPFVLLSDETGNRKLPIFIGVVEATAIAVSLHGINTNRPMTHDLIARLLSSLDDVQIERIVITRLEDKTFYAQLELEHSGEAVTVDCRPSDGIAVAIRLGVPIFAEEALEGVFIAA